LRALHPAAREQLAKLRGRPLVTPAALVLEGKIGLRLARHPMPGQVHNMRPEIAEP
jgi:hypothetical protein